MSRILSFTMPITVACLVAIGVRTQAAGASKSSADRTTVVGCLTSTTSHATAGKAGAPTQATTFMITPGLGTSRVIATSGTTGTGNSDSTSFRLDADYDGLYPQLGHKIEIVGTVEEQRNADIVSVVGPTGSVLDLPKLRVESVRVLSSACSE
jgi:hypothetical protein